MIRINLLPVREAKRQAGVRKQGTFLGIAAGAGVALSLMLNLTVSARASAKQSEIERASAELKKLEATREEVEKYRTEKEEIERKLRVITQLDTTRTGQVKVLDEIAKRIPERVWLQDLEMRDGAITMSGVSIDAEIVAEFLTALSTDPFRDIELEETTLKDEGGLKLNSFKIRGFYGPKPEPAPDAAPKRGGKPAKK